MKYYPNHYRHYDNCYHRCYRLYNNYLFYELMRQRDRYRDLYLSKQFEVNKCNPYYAEVAGCRF